MLACDSLWRMAQRRSGVWIEWLDYPIVIVQYAWQSSESTSLPAFLLCLHVRHTVMRCLDFTH